MFISGYIPYLNVPYYEVSPFGGTLLRMPCLDLTCNHALNLYYCNPRLSQSVYITAFPNCVRNTDATQPAVCPFSFSPPCPSFFTPASRPFPGPRGSRYCTTHGGTAVLTSAKYRETNVQITPEASLAVPPYPGLASDTEASAVYWYSLRKSVTSVALFISSSGGQQEGL